MKTIIWDRSMHSRWFRWIVIHGKIGHWRWRHPTCRWWTIVGWYHQGWRNIIKIFLFIIMIVWKICIWKKWIARAVQAACHWMNSSSVTSQTIRMTERFSATATVEWLKWKEKRIFPIDKKKAASFEHTLTPLWIRRWQLKFPCWPNRLWQIWHSNGYEKSIVE